MNFVEKLKFTSMALEPNVLFETLNRAPAMVLIRNINEAAIENQLYSYSLVFDTMSPYQNVVEFEKIGLTLTRLGYRVDLSPLHTSYGTKTVATINWERSEPLGESVNYNPMFGLVSAYTLKKQVDIESLIGKHLTKACEEAGEKAAAKGAREYTYTVQIKHSDNTHLGEELQKALVKMGFTIDSTFLIGIFPDPGYKKYTITFSW